MTQMNKFSQLEKDREERIKRNKERLAALQVGTIVDGLVSKETAAKQKAIQEEERRRAQLQAEVAAAGPRRRSERASAAKTRQKLAQQAHSDFDASGSDQAGSDQADDSAASGSASEDGMASGSPCSKEEEADYDPVADMACSGDRHESSEDEDEQEADTGQDSETSEPQQRPQKTKKRATGRYPTWQTEDKQPARHVDYEAFAMSDEDDDADLQRALAMSLMEANAAQAGPSKLAANVRGPSDHGSKAPDQQEAQPSANSVEAPAKQNSRSSRKAGQQGTAESRKEEQSKGISSGKRRKGFALEAGPQDIKKAFSMLAPRSKRISQELLVQVWEDVRGGKLDPAALNNMMTYAADVTGSEHLDFAAFQSLVAHFA